MPHPVRTFASAIILAHGVACSPAPDGPAFDDIMALADSLAEAGESVEAGRLLAEAASASDARHAAFSAANHLAEGGEYEEAVRALELAAELGLAEPMSLTNPTFDPMRALPAWSAISAMVERNYLETGVHAELYRLFTADQADRLYSGDPIELIEERDLDRIRRTLWLLDELTTPHPHDLLHAAMVLHHSHVPVENLRAAQLADSARSMDGAHPLANWLSAAARDRSQLRNGDKQWYGTQTMIEDGVAILDPATIDTTAVDEADRRARYAPSMEDLRLLLARFDSVSGA